MTTVKINSPLELNRTQAAALADALSICMADFHDQNGITVSSAFLRYFAPTTSGEPLSGLFAMFDPAGMGYDGKEYIDADAVLVSHNEDLDQYRIVGESSCIEAVLAITERVTKTVKPVIVTWQTLDDHGCIQDAQGEGALIDRHGIRTWALADLQGADHSLSKRDHRIVSAELEKAAKCLAQLGSRARPAGAGADQVDTASFARLLPDQARRLCKGRHAFPFRAMTGWVAADQDALIIDRLLSYADHVAVLGLISTGLHRHEACSLVANGLAGAFLGGPDACPASLPRSRSGFRLVLSTTLPDHRHWTIWQSEGELTARIAPVVTGWNNKIGGAIRFEDAFMPPIQVSAR